jgi:hypothetical protein
MTRDEFFVDVAEALRLLARLGVHELEHDVERKIASMKAGGPGVTPDDLRRYADAVDWARQDPRGLGDLVRALLRVLAAVSSELDAFRRARE